MARVRKPKPTLDSLFFVTPEQKLLRFLMSESTTSFTPRVLSSKLKGVRGLGGAEGIQKILQDLQEIGVVQFIDNNRAVCLQNEHCAVRLGKTFASVCDLEGLIEQVAPMSTKGILFGSRSTGHFRSDSDYDLFIVTHNGLGVAEVVGSHPLGKRIELTCRTPEEFAQLESRESALAAQVEKGIILWGTSW